MVNLSCARLIAVAPDPFFVVVTAEVAVVVVETKQVNENLFFLK